MIQSRLHQKYKRSIVHQYQSQRTTKLMGASVAVVAAAVVAAAVVAAAVVAAAVVTVWTAVVVGGDQHQ
jgi:hypothetical protein